MAYLPRLPHPRGEVAYQREQLATRLSPGPIADLQGSLQLQISNIANDNFIGRLGIGRIRSGVMRRAQQVRARG